MRLYDNWILKGECEAKGNRLKFYWIFYRIYIWFIIWLIRKHVNITLQSVGLLIEIKRYLYILKFTIYYNAN